MKPAWDLLRTGEGALDMDDPQFLDSYLGCKHEGRAAKAPDGTPVTKIEYNMQPLLESCLTAYEGLVEAVEYDVAYTPFAKDDDYENIAKAPA